MAGVWLFYVQHQFEDAYWAPHDEWEYVDAALRAARTSGSPPVLRWFTGSIGLHHVHHVAPRIPNYRLQSCHDDERALSKSPVVTLARAWPRFVSRSGTRTARSCVSATSCIPRTRARNSSQ